ncbi:hypothetical protein SteCoe_25888 [Stentor coeruleus]|uniref:RING-type domain-containing protein n=1 Tax=Stentor coeruleus TaxID=5963 RepID=A0A1R2BEI2_9CILI|nr:hypothetical protein SteCoe_25888 [Stentor coeruleus]
MDLDDNYMFQCPACRQHISDSQIHDHIQNCEFYYRHSSNSDLYSSINSSFDSSYHYARASLTSSESEDMVETASVDFSTRHKHMTPSKTHSIAVCPVCYNNYHNTEHPPLMLPSCGHTVCKPCLKDIKEKSIKITCPICRAPSKLEIKSLPINYALLELTEKKSQIKCHVHNHDYVAYCKDDKKILCGVCIFDHKGHICCLLNDSELQSITDEKKSKIDIQIQELNTTKKIWIEALLEMDKIIHLINERIEIHKNCIVETEKKMIKAIQDGSKKCIQDLAELAAHDTLKNLQNTFGENISSLSQQIGVLEKKIELFDELTMAEKLNDEMNIEIKPLNDVPVLTAAKNILEKLSISLDYKQAIQNQKMF